MTSPTGCGSPSFLVPFGGRGRGARGPPTLRGAPPRADVLSVRVHLPLGEASHVATSSDEQPRHLYDDFPPCHPTPFWCCCPPPFPLPLLRMWAGASDRSAVTNHLTHPHRPCDRDRRRAAAGAGAAGAHPIKINPSHLATVRFVFRF